MRSIDRIFCVQFPLGFVFEGNLLLGSAVQTASEVVTTPGHDIVQDTFGDSETFQLDWDE